MANAGDFTLEYINAFFVSALQAQRQSLLTTNRHSLYNKNKVKVSNT